MSNEAEHLPFFLVNFLTGKKRTALKWKRYAYLFFCSFIFLYLMMKNTKNDIWTMTKTPEKKICNSFSFVLDDCYPDHTKNLKWSIFVSSGRRGYGINRRKEHQSFSFLLVALPCFSLARLEIVNYAIDNLFISTDILHPFSWNEIACQTVYTHHSLENLNQSTIMII